MGDKIFKIALIFILIFSLLFMIYLKISDVPFTSFRQFKKYFRFLPPGVKFLIIFMIIVQFISFPFNFIEPGLLIYLFSFNPYLILEEKQYWRIITGQLLHSGFIHILGNMVQFLLFSPFFEKHVGKTLFIFYILNIMILIGFLEILFHYCLYLSIYRNHFGHLLVGFSGVVFSMFPISRYIVKNNKQVTSVPQHRRNLNRSEDSRSPSPILIDGIEIDKYVLCPYNEWISLVLTYLVMPKSSLTCHLAGIIAGNIYVLIVEKYKFTVNENFARFFNVSICIGLISYFLYYILG